jgi:hypothetical protein
MAFTGLFPIQNPKSNIQNPPEGLKVGKKKVLRRTGFRGYGKTKTGLRRARDANFGF